METKLNCPVCGGRGSKTPTWRDSGDPEVRQTGKIEELPRDIKKRAQVVFAGRRPALACQLFCRECLGFETHPEECRQADCFLWSYRPVKKSKKSRNPRGQEI